VARGKTTGWALGAILFQLGWGCTPVARIDPDDQAPGGTNVPDAGVGEPHRCTGALSFAPDTQYSAAALPTSFVVADLDGDGKPDLVVPTRTHDLTGGVARILVLMNQGDGTFGAGVAYDLPHDPTVGVGDLDGDGKPEIVVSDSASSTVTVLQNRGAGRFTARPAIPVASAPSPVSVGDVNGDGEADIYWFGGGRLSALLNQGAGAFTGAVLTSAPFIGDIMSAADLNGDGVIDVVSAGDADVRVYLNQGDGTFLPPVDHHPIAPVTGMSLAHWRSAGAIDILVDGTTDTVLLNSGTGTFRTQIGIASPPPFVTVGDMNGDGQADLVGLTEGAVRDTVDVWLNSGANTFTTVVRAPVARYGITVQVSDLDGDGLLDIVALSQPSADVGTVSVALNSCPH